MIYAFIDHKSQTRFTPESPCNRRIGWYNPVGKKFPLLLCAYLLLDLSVDWAAIQDVKLLNL